MFSTLYPRHVPLLSAVIAGFLSTAAPGSTFSDNFSTGINPPWNAFANGMTVNDSGSAVHVQGATPYSVWTGYGVATQYTFPATDFTASVDIMVAQFSSTKYPRSYFQAQSQSGNEVGIFYSDTSSNPGYYLEVFNPNASSVLTAEHPAFGNESTTYHTLKLSFSYETDVVTGYVDNSLIGSLQLPGNEPMVGDIQYLLDVATPAAGVNVNVYYTNFSATPGLIVPLPEPASLGLLGVGGTAMLLMRRRKAS